MSLCVIFFLSHFTSVNLLVIPWSPSPSRLSSPFNPLSPLSSLPPPPPPLCFYKGSTSTSAATLAFCNLLQWFKDSGKDLFGWSCLRASKNTRVHAESLWVEEEEEEEEEGVVVCLKEGPLGSCKDKSSIAWGRAQTSVLFLYQRVCGETWLVQTRSSIGLFGTVQQAQLWAALQR